MSKDKTVHERLGQLQIALGVIGLDASNPHFRSKYASLPAILKEVLPTVAEHGFCLVPSFDGEGVTTRLIDTETAEMVSKSTFPIPETERNPQKLGSYITYGRRYGLSAVLNLRIDEDDDGNAAAASPPPPAKVSKEQAKRLMELVAELPEDVRKKFHTHYGIEHVNQLPANLFDKVSGFLNKKLKDLSGNDQ